jgi:hypothetical protein
VVARNNQGHMCLLETIKIISELANLSRTQLVRSLDKVGDVFVRHDSAARIERVVYGVL